ncbi:MAG: class I SAM-dependent methyltransferase, partial [Acetobacter sp.]|nr:class I SAM-dependent methyltransferase [Acetobacter sp.]
TEANLTVIGERLERVKIDPAPVVTARALAPLKKLLDWACPFLTPHGMGLFLKGQQVAEEIKEAQHHWQMRVDIYPSLLSSEGTLLKVSHLNRVVS